MVESPVPAPVVGVIDVGSSGIRLEVARVGGAGIEVLEAASKSVPLGVDAFRRGHLSRATIDAVVAALRGFQKVLALHVIDKLRAVGTSALREADNADILLDRVLHATGIDIAVIDGAEENRLNYLAVTHALAGVVDVAAESAAIIEVGGGSVDITILEGGTPVASESQPLGSVRMLEAGRLVGMSQGRFVARLRRQVRSGVGKFERNLPLAKVKVFVALGSEMRLAGELVGTAINPLVARIGMDEFRMFVKETTTLTPEQISARHKLAPADAERLVPTLLTYAELVGLTGSTTIVVPRVSLRDGLILDLARSEAGVVREDLRAQVVSSAMALVRKYSADQTHARVVADLATQLFDALASEHGLGSQERLLLEVAGLLHDVGLFIGSRAHHKHSQYIISASEIFGLGHEHLEVVANVARYHRRAMPQKTHVSYMGLTRGQRNVVNKLAALLRLADSLEREHSPRFGGLTVQRADETIEVCVPLAPGDFESEQAAFEAKKDLFVEVFGKDIVLRGTHGSLP